MSDAVAVDRLQAGVRKSGMLVLIGTIIGVVSLAVSAIEASREARRAEQQKQIATEARIEAENAQKLARKEIDALNTALQESRMAIDAFHARDYPKALEHYDKALAADPANAYVLNLRAYTLFKQRKYNEALAAEEQSIRANPDYAWGYFDKARFLCALGKKDEARQAITKALAIDSDLRSKMRDDGEFTRLCGDIIPPVNAMPSSK